MDSPVIIASVYYPSRTQWGPRRLLLLKSHCALLLDYATKFADCCNFKVYWDAVEINMADFFF